MLLVEMSFDCNINGTPDAGVVEGYFTGERLSTGARVFCVLDERRAHSYTMYVFDNEVLWTAPIFHWWWSKVLGRQVAA